MIKNTWGGFPMNHQKILIVDDDENICELLRLYLEKDGFDTVVATDGEQAVQFATRYSPDLICLTLCCRSWTAGRFAAR